MSARESDLRQAQDAAARAMDALKETPFGIDGPDRAKARAEADIDTADDLSAQADRLPARWPILVPAILGVLLLIAAPFTTLVLLAAGAALLGLTVGLWFRWKKIEARRDELLDRRMEILDAYGAQDTACVAAALKTYVDLCATAKEAAARVRTAQAAQDAARQRQKAAEAPVLSGLDFVSGDSEAARASRAVTDGQARLDALREQRAVAQGQLQAVGDPVVLRSELTELERRREALLAQESALTLAAQTLEQADLGLREKFSPVLATRAAELFGALTDGRYDEITLARDLSAKARLTGEAVGWETDYLSQGARDQLYLALRLAVCELVLRSEQACPIILDDALVAFDQKRMERALELLKTVAEKRQVLLFTCHRRESRYFADDTSVTKIAL